MNIFELLAFLVVTAIAGALVGVIAGLFTGGIARGATAGAFAGPAVAVSGILLYLLVAGIRKSLRHNAKSENDKNS